ncbi:lysylphosphatidylglycerol synthase transmembrane domain-containing protein [Vulgatibacter incomptus]|uniref:Integral membrane protein n=1 Tax=Vulgatibacter incomptus TaxID=1391653 RepID=A0A0K1PHC3_9BACT|nr:lysylphosphatidylglycerol synthase transmembrane domain-containing protein [Vulgatibacter incomptus]AKU92796.1 Integral membrane protein [Vulgatibacter incomptus]
MIARFRRWALIGVAMGALLYLGFSLWAGIPALASELSSFRLSLLLPIVGLSLANYALRFAKWSYLLRRLGVRIDTRENASIFLAGLAMTITPGKAGELLKPYLVRQATGDPLTKTVPALIAERGTDALAVVGLAAIGVTTYFAEGASALFAVGGVCVGGILFLSSRTLSLGTIRAMGRIPGLAKIEGRLEELYVGMRTCLAPVPLALTLVLSAVAWGAEAVGYWLILEGFGVGGANLSVATFLYAFSSIAGAPSPGGLGVADAALQEGALHLVAGITRPQALGAALLCRLATLWLGVALGAVALLRHGASGTIDEGRPDSKRSAA